MWKYVTHLFPRLAYCAALCGCSRPNAVAAPCGDVRRAVIRERDKTSDSSVVDLSIEQFLYGSPPRVAVKIRFRNISSNMLWANTRMVDGERNFHDREIWFLIRNTSAQIAERTCSAKGVARAPTDYSRLPPGAEYSALVPLNCYALTSGEHWTITAYYQDVNPIPPPPPVGAALFVGMAVSNTIEIIVP
jgi:hypothetical protein